MFRRLWQRRPTLVILGGLAILTSPCWGGFCVLAAMKLHTEWYVWTEEDRAYKGREGLPSDARKWRAILQDIPSLGAAEEDRPDLVASSEFVKKRFPNGEWLFGVAIDSHGPYPWHRGGTVVFKDSRGRIRVFYGHVCGPGAPMSSYGIQYGKSLDEFYDLFLTGDNYTEQFLPP